MNNWLSNPIYLIVGAVGVFAAVILLRNQGNTNTAGQVTSLGESAGTSPVGQSYQYLDGTGMQHMVATDPYGNLVSYNTIPPGTGMPETGQLSSYVGMMGGQYLVAPYGSTTPYYAQAPYG